MGKPTLKTIRVLLVDDHDLVRSGFRALLETLDGIQVVGEASDGREALTRIATHHPDVVLMDISMPKLYGLFAIPLVSRDFPEVRVLVLSIYDNEEYVLQALQAGAAGYLLKNSRLPELEAAIRCVAQGQRYLTAAVSRYVIDAYLQRVGSSRSSLDRLTPRQREVLQLVAEGSTTKEISKKLGVSVKTIEMHRSQLMEALDIHDVAGLVRYAIRMKVIACDP